MKHLGDITKISGYTAPPVDVITGGSPCQDLSVAGKRAGLAGERSGLFMEQIRIIKEMRENDRRAGRSDELVRPRYMVWENVPGAFSSNGGEDFRAVLEETAKIADPGAVIPRPPAGKWQPAGCIVGDGWSIAWRLHDAQFWGVPQRRKRIALVADFGGVTAPKILFERKGMSRDSEPSGTEREETARAAGGGVEGASWGIDHVITTGGNCTAQGPCVYEEVEATLKAAGPHAVFSAISFQERAGKPGGGKETLIQQERTGALSTLNNQSVCLPINTMVATRDNDEKRTTFGIGSDGDPQFSITSAHEHGVCVAFEPGAASRVGGHIYNDGVAGAVRANAGDNQQAVVYRKTGHPQNAEQAQGWQETDVNDTLNATLNCMHDQQAVMVPDVSHSLKAKANCQYREDSETYVCTAVDCRNGTENGQVNGILQAKSTGGQGVNFQNICRQGYIVRRLTPTECERLQGYPDGWTLIGTPQEIEVRDYETTYDEDGNVKQMRVIGTHKEVEYFYIDKNGKKKRCADSARYKALGNSIALPFWCWMAKRMVQYLGDTPTMASLFDGIGGFPFAFSRVGCKPVWASEIEEFPIAVTKIRFPKEGGDE